MNYYKPFLYLLFSLASHLFLISILSAQNVFIDDICVCTEDSEIRSFSVSFGNWPTYRDSIYNVNISYNDKEGGRDTVSIMSVQGDSNGSVTLFFSNLTDIADPGEIRIEGIINSDTNTSLPVSSDFTGYSSQAELEIIAPMDTTIATCQLNGRTVEEVFDTWLTDINVVNGCGMIDLTNDWDGNYPSCQESLTIRFFATDETCGDSISSVATFSIDDCENPTPVVVNGLLSAQVSANDCVSLNINAFDAGSFDDCGEVMLSYSSDPSDTIRTFCCQIMQDIREVEFWVTDDAGNQDFLVTYVRIEGCDSPPRKIIGRITTSDGDGVQGVQVFLEDTSSLPAINSMTGPDGNYTFRDVEVNTEYSISAFKNDDILNGVNTLDILYVQQHILGLNTIDNPYTLIASNVNDDERISGADMIEMRRAILGIDSSFSNNTSWRFVDANTVLPHEELPLNYPEEIQVSDPFSQNFKAVKIGDINGTAITNIADSSVAEGNNSALRLSVLDARTEKGQLIEVDVTSDNFSSVLGFQFSLEHNPEALEFIELKSGGLNLDENNYAYFSETGILTLSWNGLKGENRDSNEVLFTLIFRAKDQSRLSDALQFTDAITISEAYSGGETRKLTLRFVQPAVDFALYQNVPNPFNSETIIKFDMPKAGSAELTFYDTSGQVRFIIKGEYAAGPNVVKIDRGDIPVRGLYIYELYMGEHRMAKKMVVAGK